jgi:ceroid-lipofuscinosis MFS transporter 7
LIQVDNKNASVKFLGWVIAVFSFGQLVGSPLFGFWSDKRPAREPLIVALLVNVIFNVLYSYCGAFPSGLAGWIMLVSRAMVGFTTGKCSSI